MAVEGENMNKVVISTCFGGFGLSKAAGLRLQALGSSKVELYTYHKNTPDEMTLVHWDGTRHDPRLVQTVEELGSEANGPNANLKIVEVQGCKYRILQNDGAEYVETPDTLEWISFSS